MMVPSSRVQRNRGVRSILAGAVLGALAPLAVHAQALAPEDKALITLNSARAAFNEKNYPFAAERFRLFLKEGGGARNDIFAGRYGLALALIEGPEKDYKTAVEMLAGPAQTADFPDQPYAAYYLAYAYRAWGVQSLADAAAKPNEAAQHQQAAAGRFAQAANQFAAAAKLFAGRVKEAPADAPLPPDLEWAARARCDQAEMLMRLNRAKEVADLLAPWTADASFARSQYRPQAMYLLGYAHFTLKDYINAGKSLASLAPFNDPAIGTHARFLLARAHHLAEERPEAAAGYEAVIAGYAAERKAAEAALANPAGLQNRPEEKARLEAILRDPPPDYVVRSTLHWGEVLYQQGKSAESLEKLAFFLQQFPKHPLAPEAQLRAGMARVQLKQFPAALATLKPLEAHPQFADQALLWTGRALVGSADPANAAAYQQALTQAMECFRKGSELARAANPQGDQAGRNRRNEILMELADTQQLAKQYKEAAAIYQKVLGYSTPESSEMVMQRLAVVMQLAGQFAESDAVCQKFMAQHPKSMLMPEVAFRFAENAFLAAVAINNPADAQAKRQYQEAVARYQKLIEAYPDSPYANPARQGAGTSLYQLGQFEEAAKLLVAIPESDRVGELASVSYVLADCRLRTLPPAADNAIAMARLIEQLREVTFLLNAYLAAEGQGPYGPDAWIKLGYAHQRAASLLADPVEQRKELANANLAYFHFNETFAAHPLAAIVVFENARVRAQQGDYGTAAEMLRKFTADPLKQSPLAPMALIRMGEYARFRKPDDAVAILTQVRAQYEAQLLQDKSRAEWVPVLQYNLGLALKEAGKPAESRAMFENVIRQFANRPEAAESIWRLGQVRRDEATAKLTAARKALAAAGGNEQQAQAAQKDIDAAINDLRQAAEFMKTSSDPLASKPEQAHLRARMLYEAAWMNRTIAEGEVDAAREKLAREAFAKLQAKVGKDLPPGVRIPPYRAPEIRRADIPLQPAEIRMREQYKAIIDASPDLALANDARFELADGMAQREEYDAAIALLAEAIDMDPAPDLAERIRLRLGGCQLAKGDAKNAAAQFNAILQNPRSYLAAQARYGVGESFMLQQKWAEAIAQFIPFRDQDLMRGVAGAADRALVRLGEAYAQTGKWQESKQAMAVLVQRFPSSPYVHQARYGIGWASQNLKQHDEAVKAYEEVVSRTGIELAARAQLNIGLCRMEQKRHEEALKAFQAVYYTYDYPELTAAALCEAALAHVELKQPDPARQLLDRVIKENPQGKWNELAKNRLAQIK